MKYRKPAYVDVFKHVNTAWMFNVTGHRVPQPGSTTCFMGHSVGPLEDQHQGTCGLVWLSRGLAELVYFSLTCFSNGIYCSVLICKPVSISWITFDLKKTNKHAGGSMWSAGCTCVCSVLQQLTKKEKNRLRMNSCWEGGKSLAHTFWANWRMYCCC